MRQFLSTQFGVGKIERTAPPPGEFPSSAGTSAVSNVRRLGPITLLIGCGAVLVAAIVLSTAILVSNFRDRALADSARELDNTALILAEHTDRAFKAVELIENSLVERMQALGIASAEDYERQMSGYEAHLMLKERVSGWPHIGSITLINSQGRLFNFSRFWPLPSIDVTDRDFFKALKSDTRLTSFMGEPVRNRATGTWTIHLVRKLDGPNGEFLGLVLGAMEMQYFEQFFGTIALGADSSIALFRDDGALLARHPHVDPAMDRSNARSALLMNVLSQTNHGAVRQIGAIDGEERLISARRLAHYPFVLVATTTTAAALADWQSETKILIGAGGAAASAIAIMFFFIVRQSSKGRKQSQQKLHEQKLQLDTALNNMSQGLLMFDASTRIVICNQQYIDMFGLSPEVVKPGCAFRDLIWHRKQKGSFTGDVDRYCADLKAALAEGKTFSLVTEAADARSIRVINQPMAGGGWVATHEDITEQRRAEKDRDSTREFLDQIIDNVPVSIVVKDASSRRIVLINRATETLWGRSRAEALGKTVYHLFPKARADQVTKDDARLMQSHSPLFIDAHPNLARPDDTRIVTSKRLAIRGDDGKPKYLVSVVEDVTDRKRAEQERDRTREFLDQIIDNVPVSIVVKDVSERRFALMNRAAEELWGLPRAKALGKTLYDLLPKERADQITANDDKLLQSGFPLCRDAHPYLARPDSHRIVTSKRLVIRGNDGTPQYLVSVVEDVTERKAVEEQLQQAQKMEIVGQLTGGMAHDFNNLLMVIIGNLDLLQDDVTDNPAAAKKVETILQASLRGADLTRQMLAFSRRQPLNPSQIDVNDLIGNTARLLERTLGRDITVKLRIGADLRPIVVDAAQLEATLVNIAINARDAMPDGGLLTIATGNAHHDTDDAAHHPGLAAGDCVTIEISDTGTGMPPDVLARIFEPFFTTKAPSHGTGLGLSMVYGFIRQSGGHISASSEVGKGTTFKLYLPQAAAAEFESKAESVTQGHAAPTRGEVILAVDDNPDVRATVVLQLREIGYQVLEADSAVAALEKLDSAAKVDLLFTDIIMPGGLDGKELAMRARTKRPHLKVLFTSGFPGATLTAGTELDVDDALLSKPYRKADLAKAVRDVLHQPARLI